MPANIFSYPPKAPAQESELSVLVIRELATALPTVHDQVTTTLSTCSCN